MTGNTSTPVPGLSMRSILEKEKLNDTNFLDWHRNLRIVLKHEKKLYVLEGPLADEEPAGANRAEREAYQKHINDRSEVSCLMMATMIPELQKQFEDMEVFEIIEQLKSMFQL